MQRSYISSKLFTIVFALLGKLRVSNRRIVGFIGGFMNRLG